MEGQFFKDLHVKPKYFLNLNNKNNYNKNFFIRAVKKLVTWYTKENTELIINQGDKKKVLA